MPADVALLLKSQIGRSTVDKMMANGGTEHDLVKRFVSQWIKNTDGKLDMLRANTDLRTALSHLNGVVSPFPGMFVAA
jgi:hypothetical protein